MLNEQVAAVELAADGGCSFAGGSGAPFGEVACSTVAESLPPLQPTATRTQLIPVARQAAAVRSRFGMTP
jgi:hypothetical protein